MQLPAHENSGTNSLTASGNRGRPGQLPWAILRPMRLRSLTPILMALAICFAPIALDVCQAACAIPVAAAVHGSATHDHAHSQHASSVGHQHVTGCHEVVSPEVNARRMRGLPHACAHTDQLPESARAYWQLLVSSPAIVATTLDVAAPALSGRSRAALFHATASLRIALTTQLRV